MGTTDDFKLGEFLGKLERASLDLPGSGGIPIIRPKLHETKAHFWSHEEIDRLL